MGFHSVFLVFLAGLAFFSEATPPGSADSNHPGFIIILASVQGSTASNVPVKLYKEAPDGSWELLNSKLLDKIQKCILLPSHRRTNDNRELHELTTKAQFATGIYKIELDTASYWKILGLNPFHHHADVVFTANDVGYRHYSIDVLVSPSSYSITAVVSESVE